MKKKELQVGMQCMITDKKSSLFGALVKITNTNPAFDSSSVQIEFVNDFPHAHGRYDKGDLIVFPYKTLIKRDVHMFKVNSKLRDALLSFWNGQKSDNGGTIDYSSKCFGYISDTLDLLEVKYFCGQPDGDEQERCFKSGAPFFTDIEAYEEILTRFNNTQIF